ncbi:unnamed protein product, partial [Brenthis ino]
MSATTTWPVELTPRPAPAPLRRSYNYFVTNKVAPTSGSAYTDGYFTPKYALGMYCLSSAGTRAAPGGGRRTAGGGEARSANCVSGIEKTLIIITRRCSR